jgi:hypothetical protein
MTIVTLVIPDELLPLLVSPEWIEERKRRWGVTSPIYQSKVLGEFPDVSDDTPDPAEVDRGGTGADAATYSSTAHCCRHRPLW